MTGLEDVGEDVQIDTMLAGTTHVLDISSPMAEAPSSGPK